MCATLLQCILRRPRCHGMQGLLFCFVMTSCWLIVVAIVAAGWVANWCKSDDERSLQSLSRRHFAGTSIAATLSGPKHSKLDTIDTLLDSVQRLVHNSATRHTVHVVGRPRASTEPHQPRRAAASQSTHGTTQRSRGRPAAWRVERYSAQSGQQQSQSSTLKWREWSDHCALHSKARCRSATEYEKFTEDECS